MSETSAQPSEEEESQTNSKILSITKNFVGRACFWAIVYSIGYYQFNVAWIILPLSVNLIYKITTREKAFELEEDDKDHKPINSVTDLPRWVYFPDTDRAGWLNKIILQLWPALQEHVDIRYLNINQSKYQISDQHF